MNDWKFGKIYVWPTCVKVIKLPILKCTIIYVGLLLSPERIIPFGKIRIILKYFWTCNRVPVNGE